MSGPFLGLAGIVFHARRRLPASARPLRRAAGIRLGAPIRAGGARSAGAGSAAHPAATARMRCAHIVPAAPLDTGVADFVAVVAVVSAGAVVVAFWQQTVEDATASRASKASDADEKFFMISPMRAEVTGSP